jgi:hypothetical protein
MSGAMMSLLADGPYATGGSGGGSDPLSISVSSNFGDPINVSGAGGTLSGAFSYTVSGGSGFYTVTAGASNMGPNPSGKLGQGSASTPPSNSATNGTFSLTWSGFAVNEVEFAYFGCSVTDTDGAHANASTGSLGVKRTS